MFRIILKQLREDAGYSQYSFADAFGVAQSTVGNWEAGTREPNFKTIQKLASFFNVSVDYLLGREGEMSDSDLMHVDNIFPIHRKRFPLLGEISCGHPIYAEEEHESYIEAGTDIHADFCLRAKGDSMIGARIMDGDIVFIKSSPIVENGSIAAVIIDDEATLKRVYYYPDQKVIRLQAENPAFKTMEFYGEELNSVRILGKAIAFPSDVL